MKKKVAMSLLVGWVAFSAATAWGYTEDSNYNFFGVGAGANNTGNYNNFFGGDAGYTNTSGYYNSFFGHEAGFSNDTGWENCFFGYHVGYANVGGFSNSFFGAQAGDANVGGYNNSFFGYNAGGNNTSGNYSSFFGFQAGAVNTTGGHNSFFGSLAGFKNETGLENSYFGDSAGLNSLGSWNSFFGNHAGQGLTDADNTGSRNSFFGVNAGDSIDTGSSNCFFGSETGLNITSGSGNTFVGSSAGYYNVTGNYNVFLGYSAGDGETGSNKLYIENGYQTLPLIYGEFDNQYLEINGTLTVQATDAYNNFQYKVFGHTGGNSHTQMVTDLADSRLTVMAAEATDYAPRLQMTGPQDGVAAVAGWMIFDYGSGIYSLPNSRFVLRHFGGSSSNYVNMIETNGRDSISFPNGNVGIGTTSPAHLIHLAGGAYSNGTTWVNASSRELKKNIQEISAEEAIKTVEKLQPVTFNYKEGDQDEHVGFIAEDVPELVATSDRKGLESMDIVAVLTKVVQEQQETDQELQKAFKEQQKTIQELLAKIGQLETALQNNQNQEASLALVDANPAFIQ